jgi:hypothetical protein
MEPLLASPIAGEPLVGTRRAWRSAFIALFAAALAFYVAVGLRASGVIDGARYFTLCDDAMISMRFARNLAEGSGLVWNPGEHPVEGYTNLLWTLWMSVLHLVSSAPGGPVLLVVASGIAILLANAVVVARMAERASGGSRWAALAAAGLVLFHYPLVFWTLRGMEVGLLALLVNVAAYELLFATNLPPAFRSAVGVASLGLAVATRTDAVVPALVLLAGVVASGRPRRGVRIAIAGAFVVFAVLAAHTWFRWRYYGDPLPNTYYLKVAGIPLVQRLGRGTGATLFTIAYRIHVLLSLALAALILHRSRALRDRAPLATLILLFVGQAAYSTWVGGDAWEWMLYPNRYLSVATPALAVAAAVGLERIVRSAREGNLDARILVIVRIGLAAAVLGALWEAVTGPTLLRKTAGIAAAMLPAALLVAERARSPLARLSSAASVRGALVATMLLLALFEGIAFTGWAVRGAFHSDDDLLQARVGLALERLTPPQLVFATPWAGGAPYYAERHAIDLLGKCDRRIARLAPSGEFVPGHNKRDYAYSIGELAPDLVLGLWKPTAADTAMIRAHGYTELSNGWFLGRHAPFDVDAAEALAACCEGKPEP